MVVIYDAHILYIELEYKVVKADALICFQRPFGLAEFYFACDINPSSFFNSMSLFEHCVVHQAQLLFNLRHKN